MISKNTLQICSISLCCLISSSIFVPTLTANASNIQPSNQETVQASNQKNKIDQELIKKASPYIKLNDYKFSLSSEGKEKLSKVEKEIVLDQLNIMNSELKKVKQAKNTNQDPNLFTLQKTDSVKVSVYENQNTENTHGFLMLYSTSSYIDVDYKWWGAQVYFSSRAINDLNDYFSVAGIASGFGAGEALGKFLAKKGVGLAAKFLGPISLFGGAVGWAMSKVDKGNGVCLNCVLYVPATITPA